MIFRIIVGALVFSALVYYICCVLEVFGLIKFTDRDVEITAGKLFIPFYYIFAKGKENKKKKK